MNSRTTATDRVRRILNVIPWVLSRPEPPTVEEACERFGVDPKTLIKEIEDVVSFVGVAPRTADVLMEVTISGGRILIHLAPYFQRPLRPDPLQALALITAAKAALELPGTDPDGPLASAVAKLTLVLAGEGADPVDVDLPEPPQEVLAALEQGRDDRRAVEIDYYSAGRGERATRTIEPHRVASARGRWYVVAHCRTAGAVRSFRLDRIARATVLDDRFDPLDATAGPVGNFEAGPDVARITVHLGPEQRWVADYDAVDSAEEAADGALRVVLPVGGDAWLERLLLRLGPGAHAELPGRDPAGIARDAASRILHRYCPETSAADR